MKEPEISVGIVNAQEIHFSLPSAKEASCGMVIFTAN